MVTGCGWEGCMSVGGCVMPCACMWVCQVLCAPLRRHVGIRAQGGHASLGTIVCVVLTASPGWMWRADGAESCACLSVFPGVPTPLSAPASLPAWVGAHRRLARVREGDLHRLRQRRDMHPAQTQAHQAVVQHAALILQAELGALWREMGGQAAEGLSQLSRGGVPGSLQDP